jgi:hypothetical protein
VFGTLRGDSGLRRFLPHSHLDRVCSGHSYRPLGCMALLCSCLGIRRKPQLRRRPHRFSGSRLQRKPCT